MSSSVIAEASNFMDVGALEERVESVLRDPLYWFPVRHHSPSVARHLAAALRARRPAILFIEGPREAQDMIPFVVDGKTRPPVAIYSSYRDDDNVLGLAGVASPAHDIPPRFASWYPLLPYSPEYVAMRIAVENRVPVVFIDLPHHALIHAERAERGEGAGPVDPGSSDEPARGQPASGAPASGEPVNAFEPARDLAPTPQTERLIVESTFYQSLAASAGYRSWPEAWDALFEVGTRHAEPESFRREMALFCAAARATTRPERIALDGTLERERHFRKVITEELAARHLRPEDAMVVCGGFHLFLDRDDPAPPPVPPTGTVYCTVAPYSYFRTSEMSGYGAGNRAPRYYQTLHECLERGDGADSAMVEHCVAVLARGRKEGEPLSSADAVAVAQHARMLASLRGRPAPTLDDLIDALMTCCCKGKPDDEGRVLQQVIADTSVGTAVGRVTPALGRLPLVHDFYAQVDALDLGEVMGRDKKLVLSVDRRDALGQRRSAFLHRLALIGVPLGGVERTLSTAAIFKETWRLAWSPKIEAALIEKNLYGDSVEAAAVAVLEEALAEDEPHAGRTAARWVASMDMDLPALASRLEPSVGAAIDADRRLPSLAEALASLRMLTQHATLRQLRRDVLEELSARAFGRACFTIADCGGVPEEERPAVVQGLLTLTEALLSSSSSSSRDEPGVSATALDGERAPLDRVLLDRALLVAGLRTASVGASSPYMRGVFQGLLCELRELDVTELASVVGAYARARPETLVEAGELLEGILKVSRTSILLGADALIGAIDELLRAAEWDTFRTLLPRVRHAFEELHARQRDALADRVARRYGLKDATRVARIETSEGAALTLAAVDREVAAILDEWDL